MSGMVSRRQIEPVQYEWAKTEAMREWDGAEGEAHDWFRVTTATLATDLEQFHGFLQKWSVGRNLKGDAKPEILRLLVTKFRPRWQTSAIATREWFESVEAYAVEIRDRGWTPRAGTPTSYASKAAFMCRPSVFAPYDDYGRVALRRRGFKVADNDYCAYMSGFWTVLEDLREFLSEDAASMSAKCARSVSPDVAAMRIVDKLLMREGGFLTRAERTASSEARRVTPRHPSTPTLGDRRLDLLVPPKRKIGPKSISLSSEEHERFLTFLRTEGLLDVIEQFADETGLYLRGRWDGPTRSGAEPCGYFFLSEASFQRGHAAALFVDPIPLSAPPNISFRKWKGVLPFTAQDWHSLVPDRRQETMVVINLQPESLRRAIDLGRKASDTFASRFDLSIDLSQLA